MSRTYDTTTEVMMLKVESDRDAFAVDVTIKLKRHPSTERYAGVPPDVDDLPADFREALKHWLELDSSGEKRINV